MTDPSRPLMIIPRAMLVILTLLAAGCAEEPATDRLEINPVTVRLVAAEEAIVPGHTLDIGVLFQIADGWHLYWDGQNDTGAPISAQLTLPGGYQTGRRRWPVPERHVSPGEILDHVYHHEVLLSWPVSVPATAAAQDSAEIVAELEWVVCREACLVGKGQVSLWLPVAQQTQPSQDAPIFARARARIPVPLPPDQPAVSYRWQGERFSIQVADSRRLAFYPAHDCGPVIDLLTTGKSTTGRLDLAFRPDQGILGPAKGILAVEWQEQAGATERSTSWYELNIAAPGGETREE